MFLFLILRFSWGFFFFEVKYKNIEICIFAIFKWFGDRSSIYTAALPPPHPSARHPALASLLLAQKLPVPSSSSSWWGLHSVPGNLLQRSEITHYLLFCEWLPSLLIRVIMEHNVFEVHACCGTRQNFLPFKGWMTPCTHRPQAVDHSGAKDTWVVSIFWLLWIMLLC